MSSCQVNSWIKINWINNVETIVLIGKVLHWTESHFNPQVVLEICWWPLVMARSPRYNLFSPHHVGVIILLSLYSRGTKRIWELHMQPFVLAYIRTQIQCPAGKPWAGPGPDMKWKNRCWNRCYLSTLKKYVLFYQWPYIIVSFVQGDKSTNLFSYDFRLFITVMKLIWL